MWENVKIFVSIILFLVFSVLLSIELIYPSKNLLGLIVMCFVWGMVSVLLLIKKKFRLQKTENGSCRKC